MDHYAEAFFSRKPGYPRRCWRMVTTDRQGTPDFCPEPIEWEGRIRASGKWYVVDSCDGHAAGVVSGRRISSEGTGTANSYFSDRTERPNELSNAQRCDVHRR